MMMISSVRKLCLSSFSGSALNFAECRKLWRDVEDRLDKRKGGCILLCCSMAATVNAHK